MYTHTVQCTQVEELSLKKRWFMLNDTQDFHQDRVKKDYCKLKLSAKQVQLPVASDFISSQSDEVTDGILKTESGISLSANHIVLGLLHSALLKLKH